ncbi:MAG: hypothetical protein KGS72_22150 [Cyanobacteria bacterium REEB67]|nr:hypothetical protein [Cyanobacteria bacterium REEB67]
MNKANLTLLGLAALLSFAPALAQADNEENKPAAIVSAQSRLASRLSDVTSIYVEQLGNGASSDMVRQKLINRLVKSGVTVTSRPETASAILTGAAEVSHRHYLHMNYAAGYMSGGTRYRAQSAVRLIGRDDKILWMSEATSWLSIGSVSSTVVRRLANGLINEIEADKKQLAVLAQPQAQ